MRTSRPPAAVRICSSAVTSSLAGVCTTSGLADGCSAALAQWRFGRRRRNAPNQRPVPHRPPSPCLDQTPRRPRNGWLARVPRQENKLLLRPCVDSCGIGSSARDRQTDRRPRRHTSPAARATASLHRPRLRARRRAAGSRPLPHARRTSPRAGSTVSARSGSSGSTCARSPSRPRCSSPGRLARCSCSTAFSPSRISRSAMARCEAATCSGSPTRFFARWSSASASSRRPAPGRCTPFGRRRTGSSCSSRSSAWPCSLRQPGC